MTILGAFTKTKIFNESGKPLESQTEKKQVIAKAKKAVESIADGVANTIIMIIFLVIIATGPVSVLGLMIAQDRGVKLFPALKSLNDKVATAIGNGLTKITNCIFRQRSHEVSKFTISHHQTPVKSEV